MSTFQFETIDEAGNPPKSRLTDAAAAFEIWGNLKEADRKASYNRARIDAAYDNDKPYSDQLFQTNGQDYRVNVSWGFARSVLDTALAGYVDIINAVQHLFKCPTEYGDPTMRSELENVVQDEVSECIRGWRDFFPTYLRLCLNFIKHGVSVAIPNDEYDWRFSATDLSDFKLPRETRVGQENIELAACLRYYTPTQLYRMIKEPKMAEEVGFNVKAIRELIIHSVHEGFADTAWGDDNWEKLERRMRNNDLYYSYGSANPQLIKVVHLWVKEYTGKISSFMINGAEQGNKFLYKKVGRFANSYQAFTVFTYGVGTSGDYHSVRGQGYDVFPIHGALNVAYCQVLELATYGSAPTFQPKDESALQELQFLPTGPYNLITPGIQVLKDSVAPNIAQNVLPVIQNFAQMFRDRTSQYNTEQLVQGAQDKTKFQMQAELGAIAKMTVAALNLFYDPLESLFREMVRRMKRRDYELEEPGGEYIIGLHRRLLQRGAQGPGPHDRYLKAFFQLDVERLTIQRAIGSGSEAARLVAMDRLMSFYGSLPDYGKQNALWDMCAETVGYKNANRYAVPPGQDEVPTVDASIAQLENSALLAGNGDSIHVLDGQNNLTHSKTHLAAEQPLIQQAQQDPNMLMQVLPGINALNQHTTEHVEKLSNDPQMQSQAAEMRQAIQQADEIIHNGMMHLAKMQRKQAAAGGGNGNGAASAVPGAPPQIGPDGQPMAPPPPTGGMDVAMNEKIRGEIAYREAKIQSLNQQSQARLQIEQMKATQKMAIEDAKAAASMMQKR
jgi:hypothetical protein